MLFRTSMTEMSTVLQSVKNNWNKAPEKLKRDVYDSDYLKVFTEAMRKFNKTTANQQVNQVIDWLVEGVAAISPHYSYIIGDNKSLINIWFFQRLPKTLADYFIRKTVTFDCDVEKYLKDKTINKKKI